MKVMGDFFRSFDWWHIVPDQTVFGKWVKGNIAARSSEGSWIVAYLTDREPVSVNLKLITASPKATGWWINPANGDRTKIDTYTSVVDQTFTIPTGWEDAVLFIDGR